MKIKFDARGAAIILVKDNKALMMMRDDKPDISYPGYWGLTGGHVDSGETFKQAAIRELKEETGYISRDPYFFMSEVYVNDKGKKMYVKRYFDLYDDKQEINCFEGQENKFLSEEEINSLKVVPAHGESAIKAIKLANGLAK